MTATIQITNSEVSTFKGCRRRWYLGYYRRLKPKTKDYTGPLALGSRVHRALELYYSTGEALLDVWAGLVATDRDIVVKLFETIAPRYLGHASGEARLEAWRARARRG